MRFWAEVCCTNPKLEYRNPKQIIMTKFQMTKTLGTEPCDLLRWHDPFEIFEFWICFGFRYSDFEFQPTNPFNVYLRVPNECGVRSKG